MSSSPEHGHAPWIRQTDRQTDEGTNERLSQLVFLSSRILFSLSLVLMCSSIVFIYFILLFYTIFIILGLIKSTLNLKEEEEEEEGRETFQLILTHTYILDLVFLFSPLSFSLLFPFPVADSLAGLPGSNYVPPGFLALLILQKLEFLWSFPFRLPNSQASHYTILSSSIA